MVQTTLESEQSNLVLTDSARVSQVLQNVIRKAVRISQSNSTIEVDCWVDEQEVAENRYIFFSIQFCGEQITNELKSIMFDLEVDNSQKLQI